MKFSVCILLLILLVVGVISCKKDSFITSKDAFVSFSDDTLHFDTVFTTTGSTTQYFKIFNNNNQKLLINSIHLMGGDSSFFKLNVDGASGTYFGGLELDAKDSVYGFVTVKLKPNNTDTPLVMRDSIRVVYNGNTHFIQLEAYGQNAYFLTNTVISNDTSWDKTLPIVIQGSLTVSEGATLSLQKGTRVYVNAKAPIQINGSLQIMGEKGSFVSFQSDRIDDPYKNYPGSWPGIYFGNNSSNNFFQNCIIKNAYQGVIVQSPTADNSTKLTLNNCIFNNIYDIAIGGTNTSINATNCLVSNCGYNVSLVSGGNYTFEHCTLASFANTYLDHKNPVLTLSNTNSDNSVITPLNCTLTNSIVYGDYGNVDNEVSLVKNTSANYNVTFNNVLYKVKKNLDVTKITLNNCLVNQSPAFDSINTGNRYFNFHLSASSPCIKAGANSILSLDLDGNSRPFVSPDLGCYQKQ